MILFVSFLKQCCVLEVACMKHHCIIMPLCVVKFCHHSEKIYNCPFGQKSRKAQENGNEASNRFVLTKIDFMKNDDMEMYPQIIYITRCLKITEKVSFNIASEASYVYILSGQKLIKNAKNGPFWRVFENLKLAVKQYYQTGQF